MRFFKDLKQEKGVAGTTVFLGLIVSLFVIGLLVMIFALMSGSLQDASYDTTTYSVTNESKAWINSTGYTLQDISYRNARGITITAAYNITNASDHVLIGSGNYSVSSSGVVTNATSTEWNNVSISYELTYDADNEATSTINDTSTAISSATDFFDLFIVIGAMVVLILLTVIIIVAIRQSGMMAGGGGTA